MSQPIDTASVEIVPDFSSFSRRLKSGVDAALRDLTSEIDRAFEQVERAAAGAGRDIGREISRGGEVAEGALREVATTARSSMAQVVVSAETASKSVGGRLSGAAGLAKAALGGLAVAAAVGLAAITGFGLKSAAALEQTQIGLESLTGSAETAKAFLGELQQFAATTPFEFAGVADASRRILAFGTSVGIVREEVIPTLTTIGDLVSVLGGTQENIDSVVRAFGQMASKGKLSQDEILQLAEALPGFNANAAIASALGLSVADTLALITAGGVDATTGINALLEGMAQFQGASGAMAKQAETLLGVFSTFKDTISIALTDAFQPVIPALKDALKSITPVLGQAIGVLAPALGEFLTKMLPLISTLVTALAPILGIFVDLAGTLLTALTPALGPLAKVFQDLLTAVAPLAVVLGTALGQAILGLVPALQELIPSIIILTPALTELVIALLPLIPPLSELLVVLVKLLVPVAKFTAAMVELFTANFDIGPIIRAIDILATGLGGLSKLDDIDWGVLWAKFAQPIKDGLAVVGGFFAKIPEQLGAFAQMVGGKLAEVGQFFARLPGQIGEFLSGLPGQLRDLALSALNDMAFAVGFGIGTIIKFFIDLPGTIAALVIQLWAMVRALFVAGVENTRAGFVIGMEKIVAFFSALPGRIAAFVSSLWARIKSLFASGVTDAKDSATSGFNDFVTFVQGLPGRVISALSALPGQLWAFGRDLANQAYNIGRDLVFGAMDGVRSVVGGIRDTLVDGFNSALAGVKAGLGISSPSVVFRDEVGKQIPAGIEEGIRAGIPDIQALLAPIIPGGGRAGAAPAAASPMSLAGITVNVMFSGVVPTESEARRTGAAAGAGVAEAIQRRSVGLAVRTA